MLSAASESEPPIALFPFCKESKWGYMNARGDMVIQPQFEAAYDFAGRLARVRTSWGFTFIDPSGSIAVSGRPYNSAGDFSEGRAWIQLHSRGPYGFIDSKGTVVIKPQFDQVQPFSEGCACVNIGARPDDVAPGLFGGKWGFVDTMGRWIRPPQYEDWADFSCGLAVVHTEGGTEFINKEGLTVLTVHYGAVGGFAVGGFSEGLTRIGNVGGSDRRVGFMDTTGQVVIAPQFQWALGFTEGLAAVYDGRKWGFIDRKGRRKIGYRFDEVGQFREGAARVKRGGAWGFIDRRGYWLVRPARGKVFNDAEDFQNGLARVHIGGEYGGPLDGIGGWEGGAWSYLDSHGVIVRRCWYDNERGPLY